MKIGIDARLYYESGVGRYIKNTLIELDRYCLSNKSDNRYYIFLSPKGFNSVKFKSDSLIKVETDIPWHSLKEQSKFPKILNSYNLDLMHFTYFSLPIFYKGNFVVTIHDLIINYVNTGKATTLPKPIYYLKRFAYYMVIKHAVKKSKLIISPSNATKKQILSRYKVNEDKIAVIPEGVDKDISKETVKPKDKIPAKFILYVGNAYPHKNLDRLIDAFEKACNDTDKSLVLVGRSDYFYKKFYSKIKNKNNIYILNNIDDKELSYLYKNAEFLVAPSVMEGFGLTPLEAMSHKCLPVVSSIDAFKEVCKNAALYFDPENVNDIKESLIRASNLTKKERLEFERKFKDRLKTFSWEKSLIKTLSVYERCNSLRSSK